MKKFIKKHKWLVICILIFMLLVGLFLIYTFLNSSRIIVSLVGNSKITQTVGIEYNDLGFKIIKNKKELLLNDIEYEIKDNIDINTIGNYNVTYDIKYKGNNYSLNREVEVVDNIEPTIETSLKEIHKDYCSGKYKEKISYVANDNYDGDITSKVESSEEDNNLVLKVTDMSNNTKILKIPITELNKPKSSLKLNGKSNVNIVNGKEYKEEGASYQDGCGKVIDNNIIIEGNVDTSINGKYTITYTYEKTGETLKRTVNVYTPSAGSKVVYLTFDDGPGAYTSKLLDILKKYDAKATFFVTCKGDDALIKREYDEGHQVALHTCSHNYSYVYQSVDNYFEDLYKVRDRVKKITGYESNIIRFPGGSSNSISRNYDGGTKIMSYLAKEVENRGFKYFDWNVSSADAGGASTSYQVYNNVVSHLKSGSSVVLQHDIKNFSVNAVEDIIKYGLENGYTFKRLEMDSPTAHHGINN